ncbi:hypothetical protein MTsPCn5_38910 [Croceitalea sp. MTPC5]|uniref:hypothetical protein n=1 Tax=Croceitalea sp. MTPC5 TaxID=3056565 RepID=UPI002B3ADBBA|nr:hypothetical protein MTsPCn5_38910 [Croceitalea sp. MTPC5]
MAQDLRELFKEQREKEKFTMSQGHEDRFLARLQDELPLDKKSNPWHWLSLAASVLVLLGVGAYFFLNDEEKSNTPIKTTEVASQNKEKDVKGISLGDLSPELQKVENYYVANINLALSNLEISAENKELVDGFLERLKELDEEYKNLNIELNELGPNDQTIEASIRNLQLRLQLMQKLKSKLDQLKSSKNEQEAATVM